MIRKTAICDVCEERIDEHEIDKNEAGSMARDFLSIRPSLLELDNVTKQGASRMFGQARQKDPDGHAL